MTTRAYVPNADGEGSLGIESKRWGAMYVSDPPADSNDSKVPSTAWVQELIAAALAKAKLDAHPVGSYYWSNDSTSPATLFGGTWEALPAGYTLIAQGSGSDSFGSYTYTAGRKYGERKHQLTTNELPHIHGTVYDLARQASVWPIGTTGVFSAPAKTEGMTFGTDFKENQGDGFILDFGKDVPHNNLQPVIASYAWRRTA